MRERFMIQILGRKLSHNAHEAAQLAADSEYVPREHDAYIYEVYNHSLSRRDIILVHGLNGAPAFYVRC